MAKKDKEELEEELDEQEQRDEMFKKYTEAIVNSKEEEKKSYRAMPNLNVSLSRPEISVSDINDVNMNEKGITNKMTTKKIPEKEEKIVEKDTFEAEETDSRDVMKIEIPSKIKKSLEKEIIEEDTEDNKKPVKINKNKTIGIKTRKDDYNAFGLTKGDIVAAAIIVVSVAILIFLVPATLDALKNM